MYTCIMYSTASCHVVPVRLTVHIHSLTFTIYFDSSTTGDEDDSIEAGPVTYSEKISAGASFIDEAGPATATLESFTEESQTTSASKSSAVLCIRLDFVISYSDSCSWCWPFCCVFGGKHSKSHSRYTNCFTEMHQPNVKQKTGIHIGTGGKLATIYKQCVVKNGNHQHRTAEH